MLILAVEQPGLLAGGVGEPDPLDDARPGSLGQHRVAALDADLRVGPVEAVVVAAGPVVRAEADGLDARDPEAGPAGRGRRSSAGVPDGTKSGGQRSAASGGSPAAACVEQRGARGR